jgi:hypothetical protein
MMAVFANRSAGPFYSSRTPRPFALLFAVAIAAASPVAASDFDQRGGQFIGFKSFSAFTNSPGENPREIVLTSPDIVARINWNELVASWDADMPGSTYLKIEARALYPDSATRYYTLALWSGDPERHPRQSVSDQKDTDGKVSTDTLSLRKASERLQIRVTLGSDDNLRPTLKFLGLSLLDATANPPPLPANHDAWGKTLAVPERTQMGYPNGRVLCSPTTVSMIMTFWSQQLKRPELDHDVPDVEKGVYDSNWRGTGNWPFNMAYAGSFKGLRAYVARLSDVSELEDWISEGFPVGLSVCYDRLRGKGPGPNGHLIVCVGFATNGDVVVNDPGTTFHVRKTFPRKNLIYAWSYSRNTVYLVYPDDAAAPKDRFGHWDSPASRQRVSLH